jgi:hypothetical protein
MKIRCAFKIYRDELLFVLGNISQNYLPLNFIFPSVFLRMNFYKIFFINLILVNAVALCSKSQEIYVPDSCISYYDSTLNKTIFTNVDQMPRYPGGEDKYLEFFVRNFSYPNQQEEYQTSYYLSAIFEADGRLSYITTNKKYPTLADYEAIRVFILMPAWKAGKCHGKPVPVKMDLSIRATHH